MYLVERHIINPEHPIYKEVDGFCFLSKNLYNKANYLIRQEFINTSKEKESGLREHAIYLNYNAIRKQLINDENYVALPRKVSNHVLMTLDKNWKSFFVSIKDWSVGNKEKYTGRPSLPKYKHKTKGRFFLDYELGAISTKSIKKGFVKLSGTNISVPFINKEHRLVGARIIPMTTGYYKVEILYEKKEAEKLNDNGSYMGIDPGVNNLAALTSNKKGFVPKLVNGKPVKSINQYYNKMTALFQSELPKGVYTSKRLKRLTEKRNNKIEHYFHQASNYIVRTSVANEINTIIIGHNDGWKQETNMSNKNNQNFVDIPFDMLFSQVQYKSDMVGINVLFNEESYTSQASFLDFDPMPVYNPKNKEKYKFSGYRESRGMYKIKKQKKRINADINGSYNTIRKAAPNAFANGVEGLAVIPTKVTFCENLPGNFYEIPC